MLRYSAMLISAVTLASAVPLSAQEIKPRSTTERLPKPASITAAQQPDGRIRVVWSAVEGTARYRVLRSVPPDPSRAVTLPNPTDTQYVDSDVKAGSTYYYLVSAVNEAGIDGLRIGSAPVTAAAISAPADTAAPLAPVAPPTDAVVRVSDYLRPQVLWKNSVPGARFIIERREDDGSNPAAVTWKEAVALIDKPWPCSTTATCQITEDPRPIRRNTKSQYRVTTVEAAPSTRRSEPVPRGCIGGEQYSWSPAEIHQLWLVKGQSLQLSNRPTVAGVQYVSMDSNTVSVPRPTTAVLMAKEFGVTYITAVELNPQDGSLKLWVWQAWVQDKPQ